MADLVIIGFDGGDPALLQQWIDDGFLPTMERIQEKGVSGELRTTAMPITPSAWTSFMTGKNPGKHGVFDFTTINDEKQVEVVNFHDMHEPTLFELLTRHSVGALNTPATYPPKPLDNGFMVAGMMSPSIEKSCLDEDIIAMLKDIGYEIEVDNTFQEDNEDALLDEMEHVLEKRVEAATTLLEEKDPDVFMTTFVVGDRASHWFWKHMDETHPDHTAEDEQYADTIKTYYQKIDHAIEQILERAGDDVNVVIMSDHGFTGLEKSININNLLIDKGYLAIRKNPLSQLRYLLFRAGLTMENVYSIVKKLNMAGMVKGIADSPDTNWLRKLLSLPFLSFSDIDWEETQAYSALHFGPIFLTCDTEEQREQVKQEITDELEQLEDEGENVVEEIEFKEDVFSGKNMDKAPDIIYRTRGMKYQSHRYFEFGSNKLFSKTHNTESGHHRMEGILLASGPLFSEGTVTGADILDITPTLLHALGYTIDADMDGRVMHDILAETRTEVAGTDELSI